MRHIVILTHPNDRFSDRGYTLGGVADEWRRAGIVVTVVDNPTRYVDADVAIMHVDLTRTPDEYINFAKQYPRSINCAVTDISKRHISSHIVRPGDGYDGPVIVKTDLNCGGQAEGELASQKSFFSKLRRAIRRRLPWSLRAEMRTIEYPIFDSVKDVPWAVWHNPSYVVEQFLPERHEDLFCMRNWFFLGDAEDHQLIFNNHPIVKPYDAVRLEPGGVVPEELRNIRARLGFEYGKFDYGVVDGRVVLYDANRTPTMLPTPAYYARFKVLAKGIESFFPSTPRLRAAG
jgi:hypothetical protein